MLFEYLENIPDLPSEFIQQIINHEEVNRSWFYDEHYKFYRVSDELKNWVYDNIPNVYKVGIQEMTGNILPHKDTGRKTALNYLITTGGGELCHYSYMGIYSGGFIPLNKVKCISRVKVEPRKWHKLNTDILHGVENVTSNRLALTINVA